MSDVMRKQLFINGEWRDSASGATIEVINPATEEVVATVASSEQADVDAAVAAARAALDGPWGKMSARDRGRLIWKIGERLMEKADEIARLETLHNGKPIFESRQIEVPAAAECFQYFAGWADKIHGETIPVRGNFLTYTLREPIGVVAAIVPWNFPLLLTSWKVAPALACGNTVIIKPATQTPLTALALAEIAQEVGIPAGRAQRDHRPGAKVGQMLVEHAGIDKIAFTGDTATGKQIMRGSAETVKQITLELGGKSPNIVFPDADIDAAVRGATTGIFYGKGEVCAAGSRLLVDESIKDEFIDKVAARAKKMVAGDPIDPKTRLGAISSKKQLENDLRYIEIAQEGRRARSSPAASARGHRHGQGLLPAADGVRRRHAGDDDRARGDLRPGARRDRVRRRRRRDRAREPVELRPRRGGLDARHQEGALRRAQAPGRHRLDQHLQRLRHGRAVRRLQAERLRPRDEHARARALHAGQECLGGSESVVASGWRLVAEAQDPGSVSDGSERGWGPARK